MRELKVGDTVRFVKEHRFYETFRSVYPEVVKLIRADGDRLYFEGGPHDRGGYSYCMDTSSYIELVKAVEEGLDFNSIEPQEFN